MGDISEFKRLNMNKYWSTRDHRTSVRLNLQHWLVNAHCGYVIDPKIPIDGETPLAIADIAAGNGAWLIDVARALPANTRLEGFDITSNNFPAKTWLPKNLNLNVYDIFTDLPEEFHGCFDVVHLRAFVSLVRNNDLGPVLRVISKMLKPSGYVQWEDMDLETIVVLSPGQDVATEATQKLAKIMEAGGKRSGVSSEWLRNLTDIFKANGFEVLRHDVTRPAAEFMKPWSEDFLLIYEELGPRFPEKSEDPQAMDRQAFAQLFERGLQEHQAGVGQDWEITQFCAKRT